MLPLLALPQSHACRGSAPGSHAVGEVNESLAQHGPHRLHDRRHALPKGPAGPCLGDLQRPPPADLSIDAIPLVEAKRHIAVLLNLEDHNISQRADGFASLQQCVPGQRCEARPMISHRAGCQRPAQSPGPWSVDSGRHSARRPHRGAGLTTPRSCPSPLVARWRSGHPWLAPAPNACRTRRGTSAADGNLPK
jgi:hypothetical protein